MKLQWVFVLGLVLSVLKVSHTLPYADQMMLANSLIVSRDNPDDLTNWVCKVCDATNKPIKTQFIQDKVKDIKSILSEYSNFIVLAFRYTNTALNVWQDILYPLQIEDSNACPGCKVQKAYKNMWQALKPSILPALKEFRDKYNHSLLYITGISLGGGLSVISYTDIRQANIFPNVKIVHFGAPRVGNSKWADHINMLTSGTIKRYVVKSDPIAVMPTCLTVLCNYKHAGILYTCYEAEAVCRYEIPEPDQLDEGMAVQIESSQNVESIVDHVDGYPKIYNFTVVNARPQKQIQNHNELQTEIEQASSVKQ